MMDAYYFLAFTEATEAFLDHVGLGAAYQARTGSGIYTAEGHLCFLAGVTVGAALSYQTQLLGHDAKRLHVFHQMTSADRLAATCELMFLHVSGGRVTPMPAAGGPCRNGPRCQPGRLAPAGPNRPPCRHSGAPGRLSELGQPRLGTAGNGPAGNMPGRREPPPPGRQAGRRSGGGLRGRHRGHRGGRLITVDRHQGCRRRGPRRGRRRGGGDHRGRRGGRARNGGGARRAGHGGAMAAEHDRQRDSHPGSDGYTSKNGDARPEARLLHAGVDRPLEPATPPHPFPIQHDTWVSAGSGDVRPRLRRPSVEHGVPAVISRDRPDLDGAVPGRRVL